MRWRSAAYRAVRPLLFQVDPERIHAATLSALRLGGSAAVGRALLSLASGTTPSAAAAAPVETMGLRFRNRIGLGAGFDKDGVAIRGWAALGLGFVELGTVTPRPQPGNPRPRLARLVEDQALINRMGFNNAGADALARRIADARPHLPHDFVIGVNLGRNRDGDASDYPSAARSVADVADYLAINVSSPNTPGLRALQEPDLLADLLSDVRAAAPRPPILVKLSPDLDEESLDALVEMLADSPAAGIILSNTTTARQGLRSQARSSEGGLSGRPLLPGAIASIDRASQGDGRLALIASGGISSDDDVRRARQAGAELVQLWTGMVYAGPGLIGEAIDASS